MDDTFDSLTPSGSRYPAAQSLPPVGMIGDEDRSAAWTYLSNLALESIEAREPYVEIADSNLNVFLYGDDPAPDNDKVTINEVQSAVISSTDIQTKEPPSVNLEPVETGEPPQTFWAGPPEIGLMLDLPPECVAGPPDPLTGQESPSLPMDQDMGDDLAELAALGVVQTPTGPLRIRPRWVVQVNDQLVADTYQGVFDVFWARSDADRHVRSFLLRTNVEGWGWRLYEYDDARKRHVLRPLSIKQVYLDPTVEDVADAAYAGVDQVIDADEAVQLYPDLADAIHAEARDGTPVRFDGMSQFGAAFDERNFRRPMIVLRTFWLRNQPCPLPVEFAVQQGMIEQRDVPVTPALEGQTDGPDGPGADAGSVAQPPGAPDASGDAPLLPEAAGMAPAGDAVGAGGQQAPAAPIAVRPALFLPGTGTEVSPEHPKWPTYPCLRQLTVIAGSVVDDRECEHFDIPLLHNVNVPIPGRPWGLGEPYRLRSMQSGRNRMIDALVTHTDYFKYPLKVIPRSVHSAIKEEYGSARVKPDQVIIVEDDILQAWQGKLDMFYDPPEVSPGLVQVQEILKTEITEQSGHAEVLQGRAQPQVKSGKAIELLQSAASSMIGFKSQRTGDVVARLGRLMLHSLVNRLSLAELYQVVSKYPEHILAAIQQRARAIQWDVKVVVSSGNGVIQRQKKQDAAMDLQMGAISLETYQERAGIDTRLEGQRMAAQQQKMMQQAGPPAAAAPQQDQTQQPPAEAA